MENCITLVLGFEYFRDSAQLEAIEKRQLTRYYEQMKQSILENSNYVDALLETAEMVYTVDLTNDRIEKIFYRDAEARHFELGIELPCSYNEYCEGRRKFISGETMENYRIADSSEKLLERFNTGAKQGCSRVPGTRCKENADLASENDSDVSGPRL